MAPRRAWGMRSMGVMNFFPKKNQKTLTVIPSGIFSSGTYGEGHEVYLHWVQEVVTNDIRVLVTYMSVIASPLQVLMHCGVSYCKYSNL